MLKGEKKIKETYNTETNTNEVENAIIEMLDTHKKFK